MLSVLSAPETWSSHHVIWKPTNDLKMYQMWCQRFYNSKCFCRHVSKPPLRAHCHAQSLHPPLKKNFFRVLFWPPPCPFFEMKPRAWNPYNCYAVEIFFCITAYLRSFELDSLQYDKSRNKYVYSVPKSTVTLKLIHCW